MTTPDYDAIVLGAGAAGLMCAAVAGQRGRRVLLLDHAEQVGKKILISGGGRCNFTNIHTAPDRYISANPHFAKSALARYTPADFIALVDAYGIAHHEKTLGQLFCDGSAKQIVAMLLEECAKGDVDIRCGQPVRAVTHADGVFSVAFGDRPVRAPNLVIATGGPSIPKMGATGFAYDLARQFGLKIVEPRPALVPLTLGGADARRAAGAARRARRAYRPQARRRRGAAGALDLPSERHRRLRQGRSDGGRHFDRKSLIANNDGQKRAGTVCGRRSRGRHRVAGRL